jgi:hypothetical protein
MPIFVGAYRQLMKASTVILIVVVLLAGTAVFSGCVTNAGPDGKGTLMGNVTVGPLTPVERVDATPILPPPEVFTSRHLIVYAADGKTKIADADIVPAGYHGTYGVSLSPGTYVLDYVRQGIGHASPLPATVTIEAGKATIVDVDFDTGIR